MDFDGVGRDLSDVKRNMCLDVHIAHFNVYFDEISEINWANIFFRILILTSIHDINLTIF